MGFELVRMAEQNKESVITASLLLYAAFYIVVSIGGMSFMADPAWAPYIQTDSTTAPDGSAWIHDDNLLWAYDGTEYRVLMDGDDPRTGGGSSVSGPIGSLWIDGARVYYIDEEQNRRWLRGSGTASGEVTFTTCGSTGRSGPSQTDCDSEYSGTDLEGEVTVVGDGIQEWTAPEDGTYRFNAYGAAAPKGSRSGDGGQGARYEAEVSLEAGDELRILIGQMGTTSGNSDAPSGGGGTFVAKVDSSGDQMFDGENVVPLVVAGGGAGYAIGTNSDSPGYSHGRMEEDGGDGTCMNSCASSPGSGGTNGDGGGGTGNRGAGGGGWYTDGGDGSNSGSGGENFLDGGLGGDGHGNNDGGFGAGGATDQSTGWGATGGGGGYSGGGGTYADSDSDDAPGGGGGSYVNPEYGELVDNEYAANDGHGKVEIEWEVAEEAEGSPGSAWIDPNEGHLHYIDEFGGERYLGDNIVE